MNKQNKFPIKGSLLSVLLIFSTLVVISCSTGTDVPPPVLTATEQLAEDVIELTRNQFEMSKLTLGKLEEKAFPELVNANGMFGVPPESHADVSSYFGGTVKKIRLLPGQKVKKGEVLFTLENPDYVQMQQDLLEAKGQLTYLKSDYERQKNLVKDNVTSQKNFLKAESDFIITTAKVESLSKKLSLMNIDPNTLTIDNIRTTINISSPISGYVTDVYISRGAFLNPSEMAVSIVNTDHLHLELNIFEKDLSKVQMDQPIKFKVQADASQQVYDASVYLVNKTIDADNRTIGILGHLADSKLTKKFAPGMYVEAEVYTTSEMHLALPQEAVVDLDGNSYVLVLTNESNEGYSFERKEVETGSSYKGYIEIFNTKDFSDESKFLIKGAFNLITE